MARVRACAGEWLELQWRSHHNVDVFLVAAWIFNLLLRFARVESRRAAQIVTLRRGESTVHPVDSRWTR